MTSFINKFISRFTQYCKSLICVNKSVVEIKFTAKDISKNTHIIMEENSSLGKIEAASVELEIGAYSFFRSGIVSSDLSIGRFCSLGENIHIGINAQAHPTEWVSTSPFQYDKAFKNTPVHTPYKIKSRKTYIGNDVWIGEGALIMEGIKIGDGAIVAARAVVSKDVEPYTIVGGIPARLIRERLPKQVSTALVEKKWWNYSLESMAGLSFNKPRDFVRQLKSRNTRQADYKKYTVVRRKRDLKIRERA